MNKNIALVVYYNRQNRYSFNALVGALETEKAFDDLKIYFYTRENELLPALNDIISQYEVTVVAVSFATTQLWETNRVASELRSKYGDRAFYIAGGPHPTGDPIGTLRMGFDIVVRGEGEETLIELLHRLDEDQTYMSVKGISFIDDAGRYRYTGRRAEIDLDRYPPFAEMYQKFGPIEISRGCPFVCYFCQTPYIFGGRQRHRSIESICKYVRIMKDRNLCDIRFITPNAFTYGSADGRHVNFQKLGQLLKEVREVINGDGRIFVGSFPSEVRPENVTEETLRLLTKYADNDNLIIGAQSGSQRVLDLCHRGHRVEDIYNAVRLTVKAGLTANVDFIFGLPGEGERDIRLTLKVMSDLVKLGARIHAHTFIPLPQTPFAQAPAGRVHKQIREMIRQLIPKRIVYGDWTEQQTVAKRIAKYLKTGTIGS